MKLSQKKETRRDENTEQSGGEGRKLMVRRGERGEREQLAAVVCQLFEAYKGLRWLEALKQQEKQLP